MKLKLRATLIIDPAETELCNQIKTFLVDNKAKFLRVNEDMTSQIHVEKCYHDEKPVRQCETLFDWTQK